MSLTSLPTELIESIAFHLDLAAFGSLRLSSSSLRQKSLHVFRGQFFRTRTVVWTQDALNGLVTLTQDVKFGSALQHLVIDATPRHLVTLWQLRKRISDAGAVFSDPSGVFFKSELQEQYMAQEKAATESTTFFNETRHDQKCLKTVFSHTPNLETITFAYDPMPRQYSLYARRYAEHSQHEMSRPLVSTLAALADSPNLQIHTIRTHPTRAHGAISIGRLESLAPVLRCFDAAFAHLHTLDIALRDWRYPDSGFELARARAPFVVRFLAKAARLRNLRLSCHSRLDADLLADLAAQCEFDRLEMCVLAHMRIRRIEDLFTLLERSAHCLKMLGLYYVCLNDAAYDWPAFLRGLSESAFGGLDALEVLDVWKGYKAHGGVLLCKEGGGCDEERVCVGVKGRSGLWKEELARCVPLLGEKPGNMLGTMPWHLNLAWYPFEGFRAEPGLCAV